LDGWYARKFGLITKWGQFFDPLADKILLLSALVPLVSLGRIPAWLGVAILAREFAVTGLRGMVALKGISVSAGEMGKVKTLLYALALMLLMVHLQVLGMVFLIAGAVVAFYSAYGYFAAHRGIFLEEG